MIEVTIITENKALTRNALDLQNGKLLVALSSKDALQFSKHMKLKNKEGDVQYQVLQTELNREEKVAMNIVWKKKVWLKQIEIQEHRVVTRDYLTNQPKVWHPNTFEASQNTFARSLETAVKAIENPEYLLIIESTAIKYKLYDSRNANVPETSATK